MKLEKPNDTNNIDIEKELENDDIYNCFMKEFSIEDIEIIKAPVDFETNVMEKIQYVEPNYVKEKESKSLTAYVSLLSLSFAIILGMILYLGKSNINIENIPIADDYFTIFSSIPTISNLTFSSIISFIRKTIEIVLSYTRYISIFSILFLVYRQYYLYKRKTIKL